MDTTQPRRSSRATRLGTLLASLALIFSLSACSSLNTLEVFNDGSLTFSGEFHDDTKALSTFGVSCEEMFKEITSSADESFENFTLQDISTDKEDACLFEAVSEGSAVDGETLIDNGDSFTLILSDSMDPELGTAFVQDDGTFDFTFTVIMPGKITEASSGDIDGNTLVIRDISAFSKPITVTGMKDPSWTGNEGQTGTEGKRGTAVVVDSPISGDLMGVLGPLSTVAFFVGVALLALIVLAIVFFIRAADKKNTDQAQLNTPIGSGGPQPPSGNAFHQS